MVAGDHHGAHPGLSRLLDASRDPGTRRVVDSEDAERGELGVLVIVCRQLPLGDDEHAHSLLGPALASLPEAGPIGVVDESLDHLLRRPLREQDAPIGGFDVTLIRFRSESKGCIPTTFLSPSSVPASIPWSAAAAAIAASTGSTDASATRRLPVPARRRPAGPR